MFRNLFRKKTNVVEEPVILDSVEASKDFPVNSDGVIQWHQDDAAIPWFDRSDALETVKKWKKAGEITSEEQRLLQKWVADGYLVVEGLIDTDRVKAFREEMESIWTREEAYEGLHISDVKINGELQIHTLQSNLLKLDLAERIKAREVSNWRIGALHLHAEAANAIFQDEEARRLCQTIFRTVAVPRYSLAFHKGSQQLLHQDTPVFHVYPRNHLIGVWIACEDITADSGPLIYCPGSHHEPLFPEFDNYPQTNRRTCDRETSARYDQYVAQLSNSYEKKLFLPKQGDALFWHGQLIHGGAPVERADSTRLSFVIHYMAQGTEVGSRISGPFNW